MTKMLDETPQIYSQPRLLIRLNANLYPNRPDFLLRLANRNLIGNIRALTQIFSLNYGALVMASNEELNNYINGGPELKNTNQRYVVSFLQEKAVARRRRICPKCIAEDVPHAVSFNFAVPIPCPRHKCMPHDICEHCKKHINYFTSELRRCVCGFRFSESALMPFPGWLTELYTKEMSIVSALTSGRIMTADMSSIFMDLAYTINFLLCNSNVTRSTPRSRNYYVWISQTDIPEMRKYWSTSRVKRSADIRNVGSFEGASADINIAC